MSKASPLRPIVFLESEHIYFRPLELKDIEVLQRWINDPDTRQFLLNVRPLNEAAEGRYVDESSTQEDRVAVLIVLRKGDRPIGSIGLQGIHWVDRRATFGILIGEPDCRGRGYGAEATRLMLRHAFETLNLHRVELDVYEFNSAGIRAYEKAGFTREGVLREHHFGQGRYADVYRYGILAREYFAQRAAGDGAVGTLNQNPARQRGAGQRDARAMGTRRAKKRQKAES